MKEKKEEFLRVYEATRAETFAALIKTALLTQVFIPKYRGASLCGAKLSLRQSLYTK